MKRRKFFIVAYYDMDPRRLLPIRDGAAREEFLLRQFNSEREAREWAEADEYCRENGYEVFNSEKGCQYDYTPKLESG